MMNEWISVKNRLPVWFEPVLVLYESDLCDVAYYCDDHKWRKGTVGGKLFVTHWQPLPDPPEQEKPFRTNKINGVSCIHLFEGDRCQEVVGYLLDESLAKGIADRLNEIWPGQQPPKNDPLKICRYCRDWDELSTGCSSILSCRRFPSWADSCPHWSPK